jgi:hypothetical protein
MRGLLRALTPVQRRVDSLAKRAETLEAALEDVRTKYSYAVALSVRSACVVSVANASRLQRVRPHAGVRAAGRRAAAC